MGGAEDRTRPVGFSRLGPLGISRHEPSTLVWKTLAPALTVPHRDLMQYSPGAQASLSREVIMPSSLVQPWEGIVGRELQPAGTEALDLSRVCPSSASSSPVFQMVSGKSVSNANPISPAQRPSWTPNEA